MPAPIIIAALMYIAGILLLILSTVAMSLFWDVLLATYNKLEKQTGFSRVQIISFAIFTIIIVLIIFKDSFEILSTCILIYAVYIIVFEDL